MSPDVDRKSPNIDRRVKRTMKNKEHGIKSRKGGGMESKSVSWSDTFQDDTFINERHESEASSDDEQSDSLTSGDKSVPLIKGENYKPGTEGMLGGGSKGLFQKRTEKWSKERNKNRLNLDIPSSSEMSNSSAGTPYQGCESETFLLSQHDASVNVLSSDFNVVNRDVKDSVNGLLIPNSLDGTILQVQDMTTDQAQKFDMKPQTDNVLVNSVSGASFVQEVKSSNADNECNNEVGNQVIQGIETNTLRRRSVPIELIRHAESSDKGSESSSVDRNIGPLNAFRQGENLSEDSGIDFTNRALLSRSKSLPARSLPVQPLKEPVSDSDQEHNGTESEKETQLKANSAVLQVIS